MKKAIAIFALVAVGVFMSASSANAGMFSKTSDESTVTSTTTRLVDLLHRFLNESYITNDLIDVRADSGDNSVIGGDDSGDITVKTGGTNAANLVDNTANAAEVLVDLESEDSADNTVTETSDESDVTLTHNDRLDDDEVIDHYVEVDNNQDSDADSGDNTVTAPDELYRVNVDTGSAAAAVGTFNKFNISFKDILRNIFRR